MATYTQDQLNRYLDHISFPQSKHPSDPLQLLTQLQARHIARVPFESVSLHYSVHRKLSLDLGDLLDKVVVKSRGGYCHEMNYFFGCVMRTLGYEVLHAGGRVNAMGKYTGMSHTINLVTINNQRYLVDVAFGSSEALHPIPLLLHSPTPFPNLLPRRGKLEFRALSHSTSPSTQQLWIYSLQENPSEDWVEQYCFTETELFREDYEINNFYTESHPSSFFVKNVVAMRGIWSEEKGQLEGMMTLFGDEVRRRVGGEMEVVEKLKSEGDRVRALEEYFYIPLDEEERAAIQGHPSEFENVTDHANVRHF
ncbi:Arylamine N-acetyltransferase 1-like protein [Cladobotryum mycophilum]|uniref:Arylamine N-acetyltransferase 1-like protein n=1 Tax=Cladobotryum mycophilum TaxID=491253 RepID=A0ABR0SBE4_9HYPO